MKVETQRVEILAVTTPVDQADLVQICGLSAGEVDDLVEYGLLRPASQTQASRTFDAGCVLSLRRACVLRERFDLDLFAMGLLFAQIEEARQLEQQIQSLQARLAGDG